jgi:hypothetical protein
MKQPRHEVAEVDADMANDMAFDMDADTQPIDALEGASGYCIQLKCVVRSSYT